MPARRQAQSNPGVRRLLDSIQRKPLGKVTFSRAGHPFSPRIMEVTASASEGRRLVSTSGPA